MQIWRRHWLSDKQSCSASIGALPQTQLSQQCSQVNIIQGGGGAYDGHVMRENSRNCCKSTARDILLATADLLVRG